MAAMGTLLALGLAARAGPVLRTAAALSSVVLLLTLYFTFGRGAWIALFFGLAVAFAADRRRLQLSAVALVLGVWPALAILAASRSHALTHADASIDAAAADGHGLAVITLATMVGAALTMLAYDAVEQRVHGVPRRLRQGYAALLVLVVCGTVVAVCARYGAPLTLVRKAYDAFRSAPVTGPDLNGRLFDLSSNGRVATWHAAWQDFKAHPLGGGGAGTFDVYWFQHRQVPLTVHDVHNLYLETLSELGPLGLLLVLGTLATPLVVLVRAGAAPLGAVAGGALGAYLLHAAAIGTGSSRP